MKYRVLTDDNSFVTGLIEDEKGIEIDSQILNAVYLSAYQFINDKLVLNEEKYQQMKKTDEDTTRINELERMLAETDYIQDGLISGLLQLKNPLTFVTDLIALLTSTLTEYPAIIAQRAEWIAELKSLKK